MSRERITAWINRAVHSPKAVWTLALVSFTESAFFIIPPDLILIPMVALRRKEWLRLALITTVTSVLGGLLGYLIGSGLFATIGEWILDTYHLHEEFTEIGEVFEDAAFITIFTAAFTPIPYKVFAIAAGVFHVSLVEFILAGIVGRGLRFVIEAFIMKTFGHTMSRMVYRYFNIFSLLFVALLLIILLFIA